MKNNPMLSCQKAAILVEKELHGSLNLKEKLQLVLHTKMCNTCSKFKNHSAEMHQLLQNQSNTVSLSSTFKSNLMKKIKQKK